MASSDKQITIAHAHVYHEIYIERSLDDERVDVARTDDGLFWASKPVNKYHLFGELLGHACAKLFDVDVPEFGVCRDDDLFWLSELIWPNTHCDGSRSDEISNFDSVGRLLILDIFIGNFDRHERNLLIDQREPVRAWAIDFEKAWASQPGTFEPYQMFSPSEVYVDLPPDMYLPHAHDFVDNVPDVLEPELTYVLNECERHAQLDVSTEGIEEDLLRRDEHLPELLEEFESALESEAGQ